MSLSMEFCVDKKMKYFLIQATVLIVHIYKLYLKPSLPQSMKIHVSWLFLLVIIVKGSLTKMPFLFSKISKLSR